MNFRKKYQSMKLQKKILFSNLVMFVLPCVILTGYLFQLVQKEVNGQLNRSKLVILNQIDQNMENMFQNIISYSNFFYSNRELNGLISKRNFGSAYEALKAEKWIRNYFKDSRMVYGSLEYGVRLLNHNGQNYSSEDNEENTYFYPDLNRLEKEDWYETLHLDSSVSYIPAYQSSEFESIGDNCAIHAVRLTKNLNSGRIIGLMEVSVKQSTLLKMFCTGIQNNRQHIFLVDDRSEILCSTDEEIKGDVISSDIYRHKMMDYDHGYFSAKMNGIHAQIYFVTNETTGWKLAMYETEPKMQWSGNTSFAVILLIAVVFVILAIVMSVYNSRYISTSVQKLKQDMKTVYKGDMSVRTSVKGMDEFGELGVQFNQMIDKIEELIAQLEREEEEKRNFEIRALQAQISPHFLYNTLASIRFLVEMDMTEKAKESLLALVKLLKRTYSDARKMIPIQEELEALENYLVLMSNRYQDTFVWEVRLEETVKNCEIPRISIQPLVENSISHGFSEKEGVGHILVEAKSDGEDLVIHVEDDGVGGDITYIQNLINGAEQNRGKEQFSAIGIRNVQERLQLIYGKSYGMTVSAAPNGGILLVIRIPQRGMTEEE